MASSHPTLPHRIAVLGAPIDLGASVRGTLMGPAALRTAGLITVLESLGLDVTDYGDVGFADIAALGDDLPPMPGTIARSSAGPGCSRVAAMNWRRPEPSRCSWAATIRCRWDR